MKKLLFPLFLAWILSSGCLQAYAHGHDEAGIEASINCDCPLDCPCRDAGGTCPESGPCAEDCPCAKAKSLANGVYINEGMVNAIERTENQLKGLKTGDNDDFIFVKGQKFLTGFKPTKEFYKNAKFRTVSGFENEGALDLPPDEIQYRKMVDPEIATLVAQSHGDCWMFGTTCAFEWLLNLVDGAKRRLSRAAGVACSGFGGCNGGNLAGDFFVQTGAVYEDEYGYRLACSRCDKTKLAGERVKATEAPFLRGKSGGRPTISDLKLTLWKKGPFPICGSASALGGGGRQDKPQRGSTNHCYALVGYFNGKTRGWLDKTYFEVANSWNEEGSSNREWGDHGYGQYVFDKDGENIVSDVLTEAQFFEYKDMKPPAPVFLHFKAGKVTFNVEIGPAVKGWTAQALQRAIEEAVAEAEGEK